MKFKFAAVTCVSALVLAGCAESPVALDSSKISGVRRVIVVGPADPVPVGVFTQTELNMQRAMTAAAAIPFAGVLGAAVAGGVAGGISAEIAHETSKPLNDEVAAEKYSYASALQDALVADLKADGYDASTAVLAHRPGRFADKFEGLSGQPDLIMDAVASATCTDVAAGDKAHFRPVIRLQVKLMRPGDTSPVMNESFVYDDALAKLDAFHVKGDAQYDIPNYGALKANIKGCLDGIKASAVPLATAVAQVVAARKDVAAAN